MRPKGVWANIVIVTAGSGNELAKKVNVVDQPNKSDWTALYQAAITFKETAPWKWIGNEDLFAVENPDNAEMGYCSILGAGGEEFGLGMFLGEDGYHRYIKVISEEVDPENPENLEESIMARSISMLLVDRNTLQKEDHEVIRSLGLRFHGRKAWPFFRAQCPGYVPWFLEKGEARFLTAVLDQALTVANEVRSGTLDWSLQRANLVLTRYYRDGRWLEEWRKAPAPSQKREERADSIDAVKEVELHLFANQAAKVNESWELDIFVLPIPIGSQSERPYFPICFLVVERNLGLVLDTNLTKPWLTILEKQDEVIQMLRKVNRIPNEIRVKSNKVRRIVEPITSILGIKLRLRSLPMLEQVKASLHKHLSGRYT